MRCSELRPIPNYVCTEEERRKLSLGKPAVLVAILTALAAGGAAAAAAGSGGN